MKIAIFGKTFDKSLNNIILDLFKHLNDNKIEISIHKHLHEYFIKNLKLKPLINNIFSKHEEITPDFDYMLSIGGDGTFLDTVSYVRDKQIPILGINTGRLGFLANVAKDDLGKALAALLEGKYSLEERSLIELHSNNKLFTDFNCALNEVTIHKKDSSSMITIHTYVDGSLLNSYWADGVICSTATGSTAYSLSVGGPLMTPDCANFILSPIASHNLTVRPIVLSENSILKFKVEGRIKSFLVSLDHRCESLEESIDLIVKKADFKIRTIKFENQTFFHTLRNKMMWGHDKRN